MFLLHDTAMSLRPNGTVHTYISCIGDNPVLMATEVSTQIGVGSTSDHFPRIMEVPTIGQALITIESNNLPTALVQHWFDAFKTQLWLFLNNVCCSYYVNDETGGIRDFKMDQIDPLCQKTCMALCSNKSQFMRLLGVVSLDKPVPIC